MASMFKKAMVYLGLVDDDYDEYEPFEEQPGPSRPGRGAYGDPTEHMQQPTHTQGSSIRTIPREAPIDDTGPSIPALPAS